MLNSLNQIINERTVSKMKKICESCKSWQGLGITKYLSTWGYCHNPKNSYDLDNDIKHRPKVTYDNNCKRFKPLNKQNKDKRS